MIYINSKMGGEIILNMINLFKGLRKNFNKIFKN